MCTFFNTEKFYSTELLTYKRVFVQKYIYCDVPLFSNITPSQPIESTQSSDRHCSCAVCV